MSTHREPGQLEARPEAGPKPESRAPSPAEALLQLEADVRALETVAELRFHLVNEPRRLLAYRQAFLVEGPTSRRPRVTAVSSLSVIDADAPLVRWVEDMIRRIARNPDAGPNTDIAGPVEFGLPAFTDPGSDLTSDYPFANLLWIPLPDRKRVPFAGLLVASERPWSGAQGTLAERLGRTYAHAWLALIGRGGVRTGRRAGRMVWPLTIAALVLAGFIEVPLTTLAPAEIVPLEPTVISAPVVGVIERIEVEPNTWVSAGTLLARYVDTELRNDLRVAEEAVMVAKAHRRRIKQSSIVDARHKRDLGVAEAELDLKLAEQAYARDRLAKAELTAPLAGLVIFADRDEWVGRPVTTGERIMVIADPDRIKVRIDVNVDDAISLAPGAPVRLFLDAAPLDPLDAVVTHAAYHAEPLPDGRLAYRVDAALEPPAGKPEVEPGTAVPGRPRIGLRGTAQIAGEQTSLYFYLFRRPLSALRQGLGW